MARWIVMGIVGIVLSPVGIVSMPVGVGAGHVGIVTMHNMGMASMRIGTIVVAIVVTLRG